MSPTWCNSLVRRFAAILGAVLALAAGHAVAAIGTPTALGNNANTANALTFATPTTVVASAGVNIVGITFSFTPTTPTVTDSAGNSYTKASTTVTFNTNEQLALFFAQVTTPLPAPCTVTATETSTTLVVTAVVSCSSTDVLTVGQAISGGSFTGQISAPCTLVGGAATCTITGGATVATPGTATISSTITVAQGNSIKASVAAVNVTGLATSSVLDVQGTGVSGTSTTTVPISPAATTGTLSQASEIAIGAVGIASIPSSYASNAPFTNMTGAGSATTAFMDWGQVIVSSTASVSYAPSWTTSRAYGANVWTFKAAGGGGAVTPRGTLMGVGP